MKSQQARTGTYKDIYVLPLFVMLITIIILVINYIASKSYYTPGLDFAALLQSSENNSAYAPGIFLLVQCFQKITGLTVNSYLFKSCMLILWFCSAYALARYILGKSWLCFFAVFAILLNPYFIWSCIMSRDTASECFFLFLVFYVLIRLYDNIQAGKKNGALYCLLPFVLGMAALVRSTNFLILFCLLAIFCFAGKVKQRRIFSIILIAFSVYTALFCFYNYKRSQAFSLSTTFGINFYIGNNRAYLHGHPNYDIDLFFAEEIFAVKKKKLQGLNEGQKNNYYFQEGLRAIRQDIPAFLYRCIMKSLWHWVNFEKIPRLSAPGTYLDTDGQTIHTGTIVVLPSLFYVVYKIFYIPLFLGALFLLFCRKLGLKEALLFVPYFALWPIVVLLFPDTRFKICAEIMAVIPMMKALQFYIRQRQAPEQKARE